MSAEIVGPLPTVCFQDGSRRVYTAPRDTMDVRYRACATHRTACDCREAELAETISELQWQIRHAQQAFAEVLKGHQTWAYSRLSESGRDEMAECKCTGCQIVRLADTGLRSAGQVGSEREAAGLPWAIGGD